jgi:D-amino-acid oxidase
MESEPDAVVVGAGVSGLTTAVCLAEAGLAVTVLTADEPRATTSAVASAMWGPSFAGPAEAVAGWTARSLEDFTALAGDPATGVRIAAGRLASRAAGDPPPPIAAMPGFRPGTAEDLPPGFGAVFRVDVPVVDMPRYLDYLVGRLAAAGGRIRRQRVASLAEVEAPVVVNATGLGARELAGDDGVRPARGQHVIVANPGLDEFFFEGGGERTWAGIFPHGDRVVLGGTYDLDDWNTEPDPAQTERILRACAAVEPRLEGARVLDVQVGLRPVRATIRVEAERLGDRLVVHDYGHGGTGVGLSWGCARSAAALAMA